MLKETRNSYFCVTPTKMFFSREILKSTVTKKVIVCFYNLGEQNFKVAAFIIFPTSIMALFEIHQRFRGHFLNELSVSFKENVPKVEKKAFASSLSMLRNNIFAN